MPEIQVGARFEKSKPTNDGSNKQRILLLGNFGLPSDQPIETCNRSTFAESVKQWKPLVSTGLSDCDGMPIDLSIAGLDDFHPDTIYENCQAFARLRQLRRQLNRPAHVDQAVKEIEGWLGAEIPDSTTTPEPEPPGTPVTKMDSGNFFDSVLSNTEAGPTAPDSGPWSSLIREIIDNSRIQTITRSVKDAEALVDQTMAHLMRRILSAARFREVESSWRSLDFLVRRVDTGDVEFGILQFSREQFLALSDEATAGEIASVLGLGEDVPGKQPWSTLLPLFWDVDASQMLSAAKNLAALGGGSTTQMMFGLHAGSVEQVAEITSSEPWRALQSTPAASGIHFAWPGFLLRLPYGERQGRVETFQFEEQLQHDVNSLNWGGGSLLTCLAVLKSLEHGESPVNPRTLEGLPLHMYQEHGKTELHPVCAVQLSQATATELRKQGVSPVIAYHEDDKAMVPGVFSMRGEPWPG